MNKKFEYISKNGMSLSSRQKELLLDIENAQCCIAEFYDIASLRFKKNYKVVVSDNGSFVETIAKEVSALENYRNKREAREWGEALSTIIVNLKRRSIECNEARTLLGMYREWDFSYNAPVLYLFKENIVKYAGDKNVPVDYVFGFVYVHEAMHAFYNSKNNNGSPSFEELEEPFAEGGMLDFLNRARVYLEAGDELFMAALNNVELKQFDGPAEYGFGLSLYRFARSEGLLERLMIRYRDVSNQIGRLDYKYRVGVNGLKRQAKYDLKYELDAKLCYKALKDILWKTYDNKPMINTFAELEPFMREAGVKLCASGVIPMPVDSPDCLSRLLHIHDKSGLDISESVVEEENQALFLKIILEKSCFFTRKAVEHRHKEMLDSQGCLYREISTMGYGAGFPVDRHANYEARRVVERFSGKNPMEIKIGHVWGNTTDPLCYTSLWNIVITPFVFRTWMDEEYSKDFLQNLQDVFRAICDRIYDARAKHAELERKWNIHNTRLLTNDDIAIDIKSDNTTTMELTISIGEKAPFDVTITLLPDLSVDLFTKSAFRQALFCPTSLYYRSNHGLYADRQSGDEFLDSLAEGGFQVGEAAKVYLGVPEENTIDAIGHKESLAATRTLFLKDNVRIAEAAFQYDGCFVRTDIIVKEGHSVKLYEVKSHSWDSTKDTFFNKAGSLDSTIRPYIYDVAFQKWVVENALREQYPGESYEVKAFLMMPDKTRVAPVDGINQMFRIVKTDGGKRVERTSNASSLAETDPVVVPFDVDDICRRVIAGETKEQNDFLRGRKFTEFIQEISQKYCDNERVWSEVSLNCYKCPFTKTSEDTSGLRDGYHECWMKAMGWREEDFQHLLSDLNGERGGRRDEYFKHGWYHLEDIEVKGEINDADGLGRVTRNLLIAGMLAGRQDILQSFRHNIHDGVYLNIPHLRSMMDSWVYPLHMIDFETSAVALPFYEGMHPYESVAFQFSHHIIRQVNGGYEIEHAGQFINAEKGHFPNFDFVRALKKELEQDNGSIFCYSHHENTILNHIAEQLVESSENDKEELLEFIYTVTHPPKDKKGSRKAGTRDMIDLCKVVKSCFYHPCMKGSNSIKCVLPAVLNTSEFIKDKYSRPIYGSEIKSCNVSENNPLRWISLDADGAVINPYKLLPPIGDYLDVDDDSIGDPPGW